MIPKIFIINVSSSIILSIILYCNFNVDILSLVFLALAFVGLGLSNTAGFGVASSVDSGVEFFSPNILLLKLLRNVSLASKRNPTFFRI